MYKKGRKKVREGKRGMEGGDGRREGGREESGRNKKRLDSVY